MKTNNYRTIGRTIRAFFGDPRNTYFSIIRLPWFIKSILEYQKKLRNKKDRIFKLNISNIYPCLTDMHQEAGSLGHYFYQDLWAAKKIYERRPAKHIDIGSRIDAFISHILVFMPVEVVDVRPLKNQVQGLTFIQDDSTSLKKYDDNCIESLSSLHAIEHFGLGRYGDPILPDGWLCAINNIIRVVRPGGRIYFSVPIGVERLEFNAHRVFSPQTIIESFQELELVEFSVVDDENVFKRNVDWRKYTDANFACGLFEFRK